MNFPFLNASMTHYNSNCLTYVGVGLKEQKKQSIIYCGLTKECTKEENTQGYIDDRRGDVDEPVW
jgi:hypothetical protein